LDPDSYTAAPTIGDSDLDKPELVIPELPDDVWLDCAQKLEEHLAQEE
jgi:hypothetical protein